MSGTYSKDPSADSVTFPFAGGVLTDAERSSSSGSTSLSSTPGAYTESSCLPR